MKREGPPLRRSPSSRLLHYAVLLLPSALLTLIAARLNSSTLFIAAAVAVMPAILLARSFPAWRPPVSGAVVLLYLSTLAVIWLAAPRVSDAAVFAARGMLFLAIVLQFAIHDLFRTGAEPRRRARKWCARLQAREAWPSELADVRHLPEVHALRDAAEIEPGPVFDLFRDSRPQVRAAAFASFIGRPAWRAREAVAVLQEARKTPESNVRALAVASLGGIDEPAIIAGLSDFFHDSYADVRAAAVWAALSDGGERWNLVRDAIRTMLADPKGKDAALPGAAGSLPVVAICDLTSWSIEGDPLGTKSVRTLIDHYSHVLQTTGDYDLITDLTNQVLDSATATSLRVELAGLLRNLGLLTPELLDRMSNADQPGPVRLLAAEAMLIVDPWHPDGLDVLRGLGRQPNREVAMAIANILQYRLGFDLGLTGETLPPNSKQAGEVAKKVMAWAVGRGGDRRLTTPTPHSGYASAAVMVPDPEDAMNVPFLEPAPPMKKLAGPKPW